MQEPLQKPSIFTVLMILGVLLIILIQAISTTQKFNTVTAHHQANAFKAYQKLSILRDTMNAPASLLTLKSGYTTDIHVPRALPTENPIITHSGPYKVSAAAYLIGDIETGEIYYEKHANTLHPIASITKLLTALTATTHIAAKASITVSAGTPITRRDYKQIRKKSQITAKDALYPLLMESNNAVAHSFANHIGEKRFITKMNQIARKIGMRHTRFTDASGISEGNVSTARDLFNLAQYIEKEAPFLLDITRHGKVQIQSNKAAYNIGNHNHFSTDTDFIGGKTGYTPEAGQTMLSIFKIEVAGEERRVALIILDSRQRKKDIQKLYRWFKRYAKMPEVST